MTDRSQKKKKRIALFVGKLGGGGAERMVSRLSFVLSEHYDVFILIYNSRISHYPVNGTVITFDRPHQSIFCSLCSLLFRFNAVLRRYRIDLVLSFLELPNLINGLWNHSCKRILSIRSYYDRKTLPAGMGRIWYHLTRLSIRRAEAVMVLSQKQKDILISEQYIPDTKIRVLPNLYNTEEIRSAASRESIPLELSPAFSGPTSVAMGRLTKKKNYRELLAVFQRVLQRLPHASLIILGEGPQETELRALCKQLGISSQVFFPGRLSNPYPVLLSSQLYIGLSNNEGFPNALVEAMICGLPVMHSACLTGPAEILDAADGGFDHVLYAPYGILLPVISPALSPDLAEARREEIAEVWCRMLQSPELREKYRELSIRRAEAYDVSRIQKMYDDLIEEVLRSS